MGVAYKLPLTSIFKQFET